MESAEVTWEREKFIEGNGRKVDALVKTFKLGRADHFLEVNVHREACRLCPGVVRVLDNNIEGGVLRLKLEFCEQGSLLEVLRTTKTTPALGQLVQWYDSMLTTLATLHENRIAHRCIDLSNWLMTASGEVKLSDFGQAKIIKSKETLQFHSIRMNKAYLERDLLNGTDVVHSPFADDMWSLGKVFFEMAVRKVFEHLNTFSQLHLEQKVTRELTSFGCPQLTQLVLGMLHTDSNQRLSAQAALETLRKITPQMQEAFEGPCPSCLNSPVMTFPCGHASCAQCWRQKVDECVKLECATCLRELQVDDLLKNTEVSRELKLEVLRRFQSACEGRKKSWKR